MPSKLFLLTQKRKEDRAREAERLRHYIAIAPHPNTIQFAAVMGRNLIAIAGVLFDADTVGSRQGETLYVVNVGHPCAAFYRPVDDQGMAAYLYQWRFHKLLNSPIKPTQKQNRKSRARNEKERVQASLIYWATEIEKKTTQAKACQIVGLKCKTYRRYRDEGLCFTSAEIAEMGTTFGELWGVVSDGQSIESIIDFD